MRIMEAVSAAIPETPEAKFWTWVIGVIVGTVAVLVALDATFARKAEAISKHDAETMVVAANTSQAAVINMNMEYLIDQQTKRQIDNELFKLRQVAEGKLSPQDRAVKARLESDRDDLVKLWLQRGRPLR